MTPPPPPPPQEIVLKVFMHCEGCARKVRRSLKGFPGGSHFFHTTPILIRGIISEPTRVCLSLGVEDVLTDCKSHKVVVKGEKADPLKVLERIQRKNHRLVELLSPIPKPPEEQKVPEEEKPKLEEKVEEVWFFLHWLVVLSYNQYFMHYFYHTYLRCGILTNYAGVYLFLLRRLRL